MQQALALLHFCAAIFQPNYARAHGDNRRLKTAAVDTAFLLPVYLMVGKPDYVRRRS
ncbi:hypothetical protein [Hymenobacter wooponensis]|uniref:hypothetical protein n=1 Tax=Hymenobacter wooponensis TaxID=1525360 RepID=UPI0014369D55|nr:hypothetical protein [Hymenobacter wooponensis]